MLDNIELGAFVLAAVLIPIGILGGKFKIFVRPSQKSQVTESSIRNKRFEVTLSFPGERRDFVEKVAKVLSQRLGKEKIFYDEWYTAELARPNIDVYLQRIYRDEAELIVVFLCADYERKEWCGLEWRAIRDLIKQKQSETIMPVRFDNVEIPGLFSIDGYVDATNRTSKQIADLILQRHSLNKEPPIDIGIPIDTDDLSSAQCIDYTKLRDLLQAKKWKEADEETLDRMCEVMGRQEESWLRSEDIQEFPCADLRIIDQLWTHHSKAKFGFSVQKKIWREHGSPRTYNANWEKFGEEVGWKKKNFMDDWWKNYGELTFDASAPSGHLPSLIGICMASGFEGRLLDAKLMLFGLALFSRVKACNM